MLTNEEAFQNFPVKYVFDMGCPKSITDEEINVSKKGCDFLKG